MGPRRPRRGLQQRSTWRGLATSQWCAPARRRSGSCSNAAGAPRPHLKAQRGKPRDSGRGESPAAGSGDPALQTIELLDERAQAVAVFHLRTSTGWTIRQTCTSFRHREQRRPPFFNRRLGRHRRSRSLCGAGPRCDRQNRRQQPLGSTALVRAGSLARRLSVHRALRLRRRALRSGVDRRPLAGTGRGDTRSLDPPFHAAAGRHATRRAGSHRTRRRGRRLVYRDDSAGTEHPGAWRTCEDVATARGPFRCSQHVCADELASPLNERRRRWSPASPHFQTKHEPSFRSGFGPRESANTWPLPDSIRTCRCVASESKFRSP